MPSPKHIKKLLKNPSYKAQQVAVRYLGTPENTLVQLTSDNDDTVSALVSKLSSNCQNATSVTEDEAKKIESLFSADSTTLQLYKSVSDSSCNPRYLNVGLSIINPAAHLLKKASLFFSEAVPSLPVNTGIAVNLLGKNATDTTELSSELQDVLTCIENTMKDACGEKKMNWALFAGMLAGVVGLITLICCYVRSRQRSLNSASQSGSDYILQHDNASEGLQRSISMQPR